MVVWFILKHQYILSSRKESNSLSLKLQFKLMSTESTDIRLNEQVSQLEKQVESLLELLESFSQENFDLHEREKQLLQDHSALLDKNDKARVQVEAMLGRLRSMEHS